jgi:16S rRNA (guanine527-N7)-methyltransferase
MRSGRERAAAPTPAAAHQIFGARLPLAERYAGLLTGPGIERGLIGPREADRLWDRHILNCAALSGLVPDSGTLVDIGSGAGLPGIILAILSPGLRITLVEPLLRRSVFLTECVADLDLRNVEVRRARAEDLAGQLTADVVTARAVAPLSKLALWACGLARPGGTVLAMKGERAAEELRESSSVLARLGVQDARIVEAGRGRVEPPAVVVRFTVPSRS